MKKLVSTSKEMSMRAVEKSRRLMGSVSPVLTLGIGGAATDKPSKVFVVLGMGGLVVAVTASTLYVAKVAVSVSIGCFTVGFVRGFRKSMKETNALLEALRVPAAK